LSSVAGPVGNAAFTLVLVTHLKEGPMAHTPHDPTTQTATADPTDIKSDGVSDVDDSSDIRSGTGEHPRLIEEHHLRGAYGEDELEATDEFGRRWYHLRPEPRRRADMFGFNYTWWLVMWIMVLFLVFLPWGHGWGY
jgi:hypothetical protein